MTISMIMFFLLKDFARMFIYKIMGSYSQKYSQIDMSGSGYSLLMVFILLYLFITVMIIKKDAFYRKNTMPQEISMLFNFSWLTVILQILATDMALFNRAGEYFYVPMLLLLGNLLEISFDKRNRTIVLAIIAVITLVYYIYNINLREWTIPFRFIWSS